MLIYVNGCSYATTSDGKRYSDFLGEHFNCKSINASIPGSSNSRILRTSLRDLLELKKTNKDIVAVISLSFLIRSELWDQNHTYQQWRNSNDGDFFSMQWSNDKNWFNTARSNRASEVSDSYKEFAINWLDWYNVEAETTKLLQELILFSSWCELNNIRYVIFSGPLQEPVDFNAPFINSFYLEVSKNKNIIDLFNQSFLEWCTQKGFTPIDEFQYNINGITKVAGHQGEAAHRAWAEYLVAHFKDTRTQ
jgi:hypothetical protein